MRRATQHLLRVVRGAPAWRVALGFAVVLSAVRIVTGSHHSDAAGTVAAVVVLVLLAVALVGREDGHGGVIYGLMVGAGALARALPLGAVARAVVFTLVATALAALLDASTAPDP